MGARAAHGWALRRLRLREDELTNRRDLLKYFGIGTVIVPMMGTQPVVEAASELIEIPKIQPVSLKVSEIGERTPCDVVRVQIMITHADGRRYGVQSDTPGSFGVALDPGKPHSFRLTLAEDAYHIPARARNLLSVISHGRNVERI
jgi:hypothetical protein